MTIATTQAAQRNSWRASARELPTAEMMKPIGGSAAWRPEDFAGDDRWIYRLSDAEIAEIMAAVARIESAGLGLMDIGRDEFAVPTLAAGLADVREELLRGRGFALVRGLPIAGRSRLQTAIAFWGIGAHIGRAISQNTKGQLLGHVTDIGGDYNKVRGYMTKSQMNFHCDRADFLSLCCLHPAKAGGAHRICSSVTLHDEMLKRDPQLVEELTFRFYRGRAVDIGEGDLPYIRQPVFSITDGHFAARGVSAAIRKGQQIEGVPPLTAKQIEAMEAYKAIADEIAIDIDFQPGDISFVQNHVTLHSRTGFEDWPEQERRRHLLRLWLSSDGAYPVHPDIEREIRGVVLPDTVLRASLEVV
ncbi:MAG: TauD/TfdA family dioxygenase [Alphaproteobacteria bacterium]